MTEHKVSLAKLANELRGHSLFSPSSSSMWLRCPGSLLANIVAQDEITEDTAYGTVGHGVGEDWLRSGERPDHLVGTVVTVREGQQVFEVEIDAEMLEYVEQYYLWTAPLPGRHFIETRVFFSEVMPIPHQGGRADHVACIPGKMTITDLKMGIGEPVYAEDNTQGALYALGFFYEWDWLYDFQEIEIRIAQPRIGIFDSWTITRKQLLEFAEHVRERAAKAWRIDAPRRPSPKACRWCKVQHDCPARVAQMFDLMAGRVDALDREISVEEMLELKRALGDKSFRPSFVEHLRLTPEQIGAIRPFESNAKSWWEKFTRELYRRMMVGERIPGQKLVMGRAGNRFFTSPSVAYRVGKRLGLSEPDLVKTKPASPAQFEEALRRKGYDKAFAASITAPMVDRAEPSYTVAPVSDRRPEVAPPSLIGDDGAFDSPEDTL